VCSGGQKHLLGTVSFRLLYPLNTDETVALLTHHASALSSWHLEKSSLLRYFSDTCSLEDIVHIESYLANVTTGTAVTRTRLPEPHVIFRHLESENIYKIIYIHIVTRLSLQTHQEL
jgi:hypothetical protein